jgi:hypothetical protein
LTPAPLVSHSWDVAQITKRLQKRWVVEGDELARDALHCIESLRLALDALLTNPSDRAAISRAKALVKRFRVDN